MDRDVVGEQVDRGDRGRDGPVEVLQEREVLDLALASGGHAVDLPGAGVEGGEQVGGAGAPVLVLDLHRSVGLGRSGRHTAWSRLERGHLIQAEDDLVRAQEAGQQVGDGPDLRGERRVTGLARVEPDVRPPGLQAIGQQHPLDRLGRDRRHDLIADELPRQLRAVPLAERPPGLLGQLAGPPHQVQGDLRGKRSAADPAADDPARRRGHPLDTDPPRSGPRWAGPQPRGRSDRAAVHPPPTPRSAHAAPGPPPRSSAASLAPRWLARRRPTRSPGGCVVQT